MTIEDRIRVSVERWLASAVEDAERRGLPELRPLLEGLAQATITLRSADWNDTMPGGGREEGGKAGSRKDGTNDGGTTGGAR